jgi:acylphosphatase
MEPDPAAKASREVRGYRVRGRVQGVGFRWWTRREAERLGVEGSVRNEVDGSVSVVATAAPTVLERFEHALRHGPPLAVVERLERVPALLDGACTGFTIEG